MKATLLSSPSGKVNPKIVNFDALNTFLPPLHVARNQATDMRNLDSSKFPALKVRNGKTVVGTTITTPNALGQRNNQYIHSVDGTIWKYWNGSSYVQVRAKGQLLTVTLNAGGAGYSTNDIITIVQGGGALGSVRVLTLGGGGAVATFSIEVVGNGYTVANALSTTVVPSGGTGCTLNITSVAALTSALGEFREFSTGTTKSTIFSNATDRYSWDGTTVTSLTAAPSSRIFTTHKGRIYWARDNDIVYSALNLINDYSGAGSGTIDVTRAKGAIVALTEFADRVWALTPYGLHGLYGTGPSNYELIDPEGNVGCASARSVIVSNDKLYWYAYDGIYEFDGATPMIISDQSANNGIIGGCTSFISGIKTTLRSLVASGSNGKYLYISIPYGAAATANNLTLVFDTKLRKWYVWD
jgi:hypothetical protein